MFRFTNRQLFASGTGLLLVAGPATFDEKPVVGRVTWLLALLRR